MPGIPRTFGKTLPGVQIAPRPSRWAAPLLAPIASGLAGLLLVSVPMPARAQAPPPAASSSSDELRELRLELQRLRQEVAALREEIRRGKAPAPGEYAPAPGVAPPGQAGEPAGASLELLQAQVAEHAQTKVESNSRQPVKLFGNIVSSTFFNTGEANWPDMPNLVGAAPPAPLEKGSFSSTLRHTRLGAIVDGPTIGTMKSSGLLVVDFAGGVPNFQTGQVFGLPRLLYAYARLEGPRTAFQAGQDQMVLAPANPTSLAGTAFPNLYRSGNLYLRAPHLRVERRFVASETNEFQIAAGILAPVGMDGGPASFEFVLPTQAGERSRQPAVQGRLSWRRSAGEEKRFLLGVSAHTSGQRTPATSRRSWAVAMDFDARAGRFGLGGEWFVGRNIGAFGGSLGQFAQSAGGFIEGRFRATPRLEFNAGFGTDRLFDLDNFPALLERNSSVFGNFIFDVTPELAASLEYRWLSTVPAVAGSRRNHHLNLVFVYRF